MATLSLKISLEGGAVVKTMQFEPSTTVYDACRTIREKILEAANTTGDPKEYGLFLTSDDDSKKGIWLEPSRSLDYYILRNGDLLHYNKKTRNLRVRMLDGTVKTLLVDDSQIVANLMVVICTKIGITNYDEYGLVREEQKDEVDQCDKPNYGTLTMRRKHQEKERDAKMDQLRKKLRTDDEVNWVEGSKTLREQGIDSTETLLLRRKLFYSDRNVDSRDPVQLNLLYVQARDALVEGTHPVTQDKACEFAGLQCQIQFGDHREDKHTPGFLDLKEFLPPSYAKIRSLEKKVLKEHKRHIGLSELDAKVLYTKSARSLPTYGVAFFLVKEKMKGKNKLVPRLLGVTKDSVLRLDEKTKETLQCWPLTTVRRWCASPNTFTLDFGDYSDQYYSVQTTEAEQILQVIAGYIDIIVRRQRARDHLGIEGDEGEALLEDATLPSRANIIQHDTYKSARVSTESVAKPAVVRPGAEGAKPFSVGHYTSAQQTTISGQIITGHASPAASQVQQTKVTSVLTEPQRALSTTITSGREIIKQTEETLVRATLPELGEDSASMKWKQTTMDSSRQLVTSQIAAMNAATAQVVTLTSGPTEEVDHTAVGAAITTISSNLPEMSRGVQLIAALMEEDTAGDSLLDATRKLCAAFSDLLDAAHPATSEPRQNLLNAASRVGEASTSVLQTIGEENEEDKETQDILLSLAKAVANATAVLVMKAKNVAAQCKHDQQLQSSIISAATHCALATSQLVACAKVVAPTLHNPACREQLTNAAKQVMEAVHRLLDSCSQVCDSEELTAAAQKLLNALESVLAQANAAEKSQIAPTQSSTNVEHVLSAWERLAHSGSQRDMLKHARELGQATAQLITNIKTEAESQPSESQRKLLAAAKLLADATARMVEAARQCASSPDDQEKQAVLKRCAEELRFITTEYVTGSEDNLARLRSRAGDTAAAARQLGAAATHVSHTMREEILIEEFKALDEQVPRVLDAVKVSSMRPDDAAAQLGLINACEDMLQVSTHAIQATRATLPTVSDAHTHKHLADTTLYFTQQCSELRSCVNRARSSSRDMEVEAASQIIRSLQEELVDVEEAHKAGRLQPLPGETREWASETMRQSALASASAAAALARPTPAAPGALASELQRFTSAVRASAAQDQGDASSVITNGHQVLETSLTLVETVKRYLSTSETVHIQKMVEISKELNQNLERTMESVPSHTVLEQTIETINETLNILNSGEFPASDRSYSDLQSELTSAASNLNWRSTQVAEAAQGAPGALNAAGEHFGEAFNRLCGAALEVAGQTEEQESRADMVRHMKSVTTASARLLGAAKDARRDPNRQARLAAAARDLADAINALLNVCTQASPGQKACSAAITNIEATRPLLNAPSQPLTDLGYFCTLDEVVQQSKNLSEGMSGMAQSIKSGAVPQFCSSVAAVGDAVCALVECTAQTAYLMAVSDPTSVAGRPGLVDQAQFSRASLAIEQACRALCDPSSAQQQVLSAATVIAKHTSALCNACRTASGRAARAPDKRHFVHSAKDVANCTAALVKDIKALDQDYSTENRDRCAQATAPLLEAVRSLCQFAGAPEFAAVPARLGGSARASQQPVLDCGRNIITGACDMISAARVLSLNPTQRSHWQDLASHSKTVSDCIKTLVTNIRENAPGQRECQASLDTLNKLMRELDQASMAEVDDTLAPRNTNNMDGYTEQIENACSEILNRLEPLCIAAKSEAENLGHAVVNLVSYAEPLLNSCIGLASITGSWSSRSSLLQLARTALETLGELVTAASRARGNPRATSEHAEVTEASTRCAAALHELSAPARAASALTPLLQRLASASALKPTNRLSLLGSYDESDSFVDYQTRMVAAAKDIAKLATDMSAKSGTTSDINWLVTLGGQMCSKYEQLAADSVGAAATTPNSDIANRIRSSVMELGESVARTVRAGGQGKGSGESVATHAHQVHQNAVSVLSALQAGSRGTQACLDAAATIASIIGDLDTTILFASAGTLQSDKQSDTFSDHREQILQTAKSLVEDTKRLVGGAAGEQDQLATAAHSSVNTIVQLCEVVKLGAMSLGSASGESQVLLLNSARDVAAALRDLAAATAAASGKPLQHPTTEGLKHAAKRLTDVTKRWSLPIKPTTLPRQTKRRSINFTLRNDSYDSETDFYQSDLEDELIKLLDYSSQEDDVSPSIFHDDCEDVIAYIEDLMHDPPRKIKDDNLNDRYNMAAKNSLVDMDSRVMKYGENILLGEIKKFVDLVVETADKIELKRKRDKISRLRASSDLDNEMKRLSQVVDDLDSEIEAEEIVKTPAKSLQLKFTKKPLEEKLLKHRLRNPVFKLTKVKPVKLNINLTINSRTPMTKKDIVEKVMETPKETHKEIEVMEVKPEIVDNNQNVQFWKTFQNDSDWWRALAKRNLDKMEETRRELERFSGHELVLGEIQNDINRYDKEKETLQTFIDEIDNSKTIKKDLEYDKKYEDMVLKLIQFAKKDFNYKGFDPLIEQLKALSNIEMERRKKKVVNIQDIIKMYTEIDITQFTYEELVILEKYYTEIIRKYQSLIEGKENVEPREDSRSPSLVREPSPSYHKNVILNINSQQTLTKNINQYTHSNNSSLERTKKRHNQEIFDLTRTYPEEYYANNWWSIYEDILKNREKQYGSIDNWWNFYEAILNKEDTNDEELKRIRSVVEYRNSLRKRPKSRLEEQLKMLDEIKNDRFTESEDVNVTTQDSQSVMVTNVTSLLKTVKAVEDEHTRGNRALESTIEAISQEISVLMSPTPPKSTATPEELIRVTRHMTVATAKAVSAGNSGKQDLLTAAANLGRKTVLDLLTCCKAAAFTAETEDLKQRTLACGSAAAHAYRALLSAILAGEKGELPELSRHVARSVADIIAHAEMLKGSDWVDPDDPTVIAENELLGAAASIDAAAKKLDSLRPRKSVQVQEADESLNFDEMILEAARCIIAATSALVRAASAAQRELIDQGKVARQPTSSSDDGQWSEGLISAARLVAAAAHSLVEAANALVQGAGSEERLISSARHVASSTAQLLVACKVKADPTSESTRRLQTAGAEVIRSTSNLVAAARDSIATHDERSLVLDRRMVGGIAQEIDARSDVLRIERELKEAQDRLNAIRKARYELKTGATSGEETDTDHCGAGYSSDASATPLRFKNQLNSSYGNTTYSPNSTYSPHTTQNTTNLSNQVNQLNQSIHGTPTSPGFNKNASYSNTYGHNSPGYGQNSTGYGQNSTGYGQNTTSYGQNSTSFGENSPGYGQNSTGFSQNSTGFVQNTSGYSQNASGAGQTPARPSNFGQNVNNYSQNSNNYTQNTSETTHGSYSQTKNLQSPTFSSFRPQNDSPKQNYEGFTTRHETSTNNDRTMANETETETTMTETTVTVRTLQLPEVRTAHLVTEDSKSIIFKKQKPPPPPRTVNLGLNYETRLYDTPRPTTNYIKTEEKRQFESNQHQQFKEQKVYGSPKLSSPISPKFNARDLKFEEKSEPIYSTLNKPRTSKSPFDGVGQSFCEHQKSTEAIPGGTKQTEVTVKSESYQSYPKTEYIKTESREPKSPFATSTPTKFEKSNYFSQQESNKNISKDLVKVQTPEFERISSPYGKEVHNYGGPNFMEETTTEVKEIPNGTQKITTTKIYSSSPVNITSTNTKYEPIKLDGIDELSKSFDNDSKYSTLDSRFNTLDSKMSSDTSRSFMRPSQFQSSDYQSSTSVSKIKKPSEIVKDVESLDKKFSNQTIKSEKIERKSVMTSSHKSETSSTVTKKFGNL